MKLSIIFGFLVIAMINMCLSQEDIPDDGLEDEDFDECDFLAVREFN